MLSEFSTLTAILPAAILGTCRTKDLSVARAVYWRLLHGTGHSYSEIGRMSNRTHSTVMHGIKMINDALSVGVKDIEKLVNKTEHLKHKYMLKTIIEIIPPSTVGTGKKVFEAVFLCCNYCHDRGGFIIDEYDFAYNVDEGVTYNPCPYCKGTGQVKGVVTVEFVSHGEVKGEFK